MKRITIGKIVTDVYFTGVKLSNSCGGIACTPTADLYYPCCSILTMGQKRGASKGAAVYDILTSPPVSSLITATKIVVTNALGVCVHNIGIPRNSLEVLRQV